MHNVSSAGQALHYFSSDNYYTQDEGLEKSEWFGIGADALGLSGQIDRQAFFDVLNGKIDGQELGKLVLNEKTGQTERDHRPGTDITFSAPKSVSLLAEVAGNSDVREAHEAAVKKALLYIESELIYTRQMKDGQIKAVKTGNVIVGMFRHNTSRDLDPQTHTHAVLINATRRTDGMWRSLTNDEIFKAQRIIGAIYTGELAQRLQELGYELRRTDDRGNFEIVGVTREQIEHFSKRRAEIETSLNARGVDINNASAQDKENATLMTRAKKVDVDHELLISDWKNRANAVGLKLPEIVAKAKTMRGQGGIVREDRLTGRQAMEFAAAHLIEREAVVAKEDLLRTALEHGIGRVSPAAVQNAFEKLELEGHLIRLPDGQYTTKKMLGSEEWALEQVRVQKGQTQSIISPSTIFKHLAKIEGRQGFKFTEGQKEAIAKVLTSTDRYVAVQGLAGTGKTTMLKSLRELAQNEGYTVRGMAPTGAASKILASETKIATDTIAMFQIKERQLQKDIEFAKQYASDFVRKNELWIVDESSFLSQRQKSQLDYMAIKAGAKIAYLGDAFQLQGVEAGKPFELAQKEGIETAYMTEISRQKTPDLKVAVDIIVGRDQVEESGKLTAIELKHNARAFEHMDKNGMVREIKNDGLVSTMVKDFLEMSKVERERTIIITAYNEDRHQINADVRDGLKKSGELSYSEQTKEIFVSKGWTRAMIKEAQYYQIGDVVRFGRDYKQVAASKGEYMRVMSTDVSNGVVKLQKESGSTIIWEPQKYNNVEVYDSDMREIAVGDLIRITRNDGIFKNGEVVQVSNISGDRVILELKQGNVTSKHEVNLAQSKHWDYAYASTVHASQGTTQYRTMFHIRTPESDNERKQAQQLANMAKIFGNRSFYVGSTRASHRLVIYTNDKIMAANVISAQQDKTSAVEILRSKGIEQNRYLGVSR